MQETPREEVNNQDIVEELKAQRNALADQLALAGALIVKQRRQIAELAAKVPEA